MATDTPPAATAPADEIPRRQPSITGPTSDLERTRDYRDDVALLDGLLALIEEGVRDVLDTWDTADTVIAGIEATLNATKPAANTEARVMVATHVLVQYRTLRTARADTLTLWRRAHHRARHYEHPAC